MYNLTVVAESALHPGRRLLQSRDGQGFIQLEPGADPKQLLDADFARLRAMHHYRPQPRTLSFAPVEAYELSD